MYYILMNSSHQPLILVYYSFRGLAQPIRRLLCYLELGYSEVHLDRLQQQSQELLPHILQHYKTFKINKNQLPALIHGQTYIENVHPITIYLATKFQRSDLLGSTLQTRTRVKQITEIYFSQQHIVYDVLRLAEYCSKHSLGEITARCRDMFQELMNNSRYIRQISQYLDRQQHPLFVLNQLTIIDFFYFETCQYILGVFDHEDRVYKEGMAGKAQNGSFLNKPNGYYVKVMRAFHDEMRKGGYEKYEAFLDSFSMKCPLFNQAKAQGLMKIWLGNMNWIT